MAIDSNSEAGTGRLRGRPATFAPSPLAALGVLPHLPMGEMAELVGMVRRDDNNEDGYKVMTGWRVGHAPDESTTRSGLLVPAGIKEGNDALPLVDVHTGQRFWAVPAGAWRFIWPPTGRPVIAVRESQIIAEEELSHVGDGGQYL